MARLKNIFGGWFRRFVKMPGSASDRPFDNTHQMHEFMDRAYKDAQKNHKGELTALFKKYSSADGNYFSTAKID